jgi:hypothetical protein
MANRRFSSCLASDEITIMIAELVVTSGLRSSLIGLLGSGMVWFWLSRVEL